MNTFENELFSHCLHHHVIKQEENLVNTSSKFRFPASFIGFEGHFPGQPVLPAVIQLISVRLLTEKTLDQYLFPSQYGKTKFRQIVEPEQDIVIEIEMACEIKEVNCQFKLKQSDGQKISEGSCLFAYL